MKIGDIIKAECMFHCGEKHKFRIDRVDRGRANGVIVKRSDCKEGIYCQWMDIPK